MEPPRFTPTSCRLSLGTDNQARTLGRLESRDSAHLTAKLDGHSWIVAFLVYIDVPARTDSTTIMAWRVTATSLARCLSTHREASISPCETLRYRGELSPLRGKHCDDLNTKSGRPAVVRRGELAVTKRLAVFAPGVRGDASPGGIASGSGRSRNSST